jgi:glycosyltransferase involved in cell wall biosynthesis
VLVGTVGLLTEQKDQATLIRGLAIARERTGQPLELSLAGDGPLDDELRRLATELDVADSVHFLGYLDRLQVYKMLLEIDIYAMPSKWEGFSAAAAEGLAAGNATIFSEIPPFAEPYRDVALFHPVGDAESLADNLVTLVTDSPERDRLASAGKTLIRENYEMSTVSTAYRDLYLELLD